jgi:c-di-GMP-binding flagellar brake protein YcgR
MGRLMTAVSPQSTTEQPVAAEMLQAACDRNLPLQLHYRGPAVGGIVDTGNLVAQTRMLAIEPEGLAVDWPQAIARTVRLGTGTEVNGYFTFNEKLYRIRTTVMSLRYKMMLNDQRELVGCLLAMPSEVQTGQRREDHRASVASMDPIVVQIHQASRSEIGSAPSIARPIAGRLINLSRGGLRVGIEGEERHRFHAGDWFFLSFKTPNSEKPLTFLAEARSTTPMMRGQAVAVGMQFLNWPDAAALRVQSQAVGRIIADIERAQLRRAAGRT